MCKLFNTDALCAGFIIALIFPIHNLKAQTIVSGRLLDQETRTPLSFASLRIIGKPIGTVTNDDGEFNFEIPLMYAHDTLEISMMGYDPYKICVKNIKEPHLLVRLKIRPIQLNEVVITDTKLTAKEIIKKAYESIESNFALDPFVLKGFFRETHQENQRNVMLVEAALNIYDRGYKVIHERISRVKEKVALKNVRASKNYRNSLFNNTVVQKYNLVNSALRWNLVKYRNPNVKKELSGKDFSLDSVIYFNNKLVYVISFLSYIPRYPNFERKNTLYIDAQNFAIYKYGWDEYAKEGKYSEKPWRLTKDSAYFTYRKRISTVYEYENYNGKMLLKYFDEKCYDDIYNAKKNLVELEALGHTTLIITGIETGQIKPEIKLLMLSDKSLSDQTTAYDKEFWNNYQDLLPLTKKQIKDLEWETPLEKQFQLAQSKN